MDNEIEIELNELKAKSKHSPQERARIKLLERKISTAKKKESNAPQTNVFAIEKTTTVTPLPIRFLSSERSGLRTRSDDIKSNKELIARELGSMRHINETKLIRAAIRLLEKHSDEEIVMAIKQIVIDEMVGRK